MTRRRRHGPPDDDPIARYREWVDNRYNPGYWVGRVPPAVRNLWSTKDRRVLGSLYVGACAIGYGIIVLKAPGPDAAILASVALVPILIPGLIMLFARDQKPRK